VYAFDAFSKDPVPIWRYDASDGTTTLGPVSGASSGFDKVPYSNRIYINDAGEKTGQGITPSVGIIGTPVIDMAHSTMYFVAMTNENSASINEPKFVHTLHAISLVDGTRRMTITIKPELQGLGWRSERQNQRSALALANDRIYIAWASFDDMTPFVGLVLAYFTVDSTQPLQPAGQFQVTGTSPCPSGNILGIGDGPNRLKGGIWHSGGGVAVDDQNFIYVVTGNGDSDNDNKCPGRDLDSSSVKLSPDLKVKDFFTPSYNNVLNTIDLDLSVAGPMIPTDQPNESGKPTKLLIHGSKAGIVYVLNRDDLGQYNEHSNRVIQELHVFPDACHGVACTKVLAYRDPTHVHTTPVFWKAPDGPRVFIGSDYNLGVRAFRFDHEKLNPTPVAANFFPRAPISQMSLSSFGDSPGTGILWFISSPAGILASYPGILYAFSAENLDMLYSSETNPFDRLGDYPRFNAPVVANHLVYVPTFSNKVAVYGLCQPGVNALRCR
jgi:hypothetical protein